MLWKPKQPWEADMSKEAIVHIQSQVPSLCDHMYKP